MFLELIRYIRYVCKSAHRIVCENMCWSLTNKGDVGIRSQDCMWEYVMCICDTVLWSIICVCFWITLRFEYIYMCSVVPYMFGKPYRIFWVKLWNQTRALLDSILLYIVYNCLLDVWLTPSITIFRLKFSWGTEPLDCFVRCKVERESFRRSQ